MRMATYFSEALEDSHLVTSFRNWVDAATLHKLETKSLWTEEELKSIQEEVIGRHEDGDWVETW